MTQETETMLRKSLDAVDKHRRRLLWTIGIASLTVLWEFYRLIVNKPSADVPSLIVEGVIVVCFWILALVVMIVYQMTIATKRILRAIELSSKGGV